MQSHLDRDQHSHSSKGLLSPNTQTILKTIRVQAHLTEQTSSTNKLNLILILNGLESCAHSVTLRAVMVVIGVYVYRRSTSKYVRRWMMMDEYSQ